MSEVEFKYQLYFGKEGQRLWQLWLFSDKSDEALEILANKPFEDLILSFFDSKMNLDRVIPYKRLVHSLIVRDWSPSWDLLYVLSDLLYISIDLTNAKIDLKKFTKLEAASLVWFKNFENSLNGHPKLKSLTMEGYKSASLESVIDDLPSLEFLSIMYSKQIMTLDGVDRLSNLDTILLKNCSQLHSITALMNNPTIKKVRLEACPKVADISVVSTIPNLESLEIFDCDVDSLGWLVGNETIKDLVFNCRIKDGNLGFIKQMPNLQTVRFQDRRNFNLKNEEAIAFLKQR